MVRRSSQSKSVYWGAIVLDTFEQLLKAKLCGNDLRVFLYLCSKMLHEDNTCYENQKSISDNLQIHKTSVSKAIKVLVEKQFIAKAVSPKRFMINPHLFYIAKKNPVEREDIRARFDKIVRSTNQEPLFYMNEDTNTLELSDGSRWPNPRQLGGIT